MTLKIVSEATGGRIQNETPIDVLTVGAAGLITLPGNLVMPAGVLKQAGNKKIGCSVFISANTAFTRNVDTKIPYTGVGWNPNGAFNTSTNRFTPDVPGWYAVHLTSSTNGDAASDNCQTHINKNGFTNITVGLTNTSSAVLLVCVHSGSQLVYMNGTTDYIEGHVYRGQASGTCTLNGDAGGSANRLSAILMYPD
ncbi:hypothetical protein [Variovorax sp. 278MFTsu5.1]|uniref:hypothetical protein n=1 Tax=Variovorax sp. 278MFTsu5.1 TaxID=3158366 RepID=UPI003AAA2CE1